MLAISREDEDTVSKYLDKNGFTVRTASRSSSGDQYGVRGIPAAFLIAPDGTLAWSGHPSGISKSVIKELLKDAKKLPDLPFLVVKPSGEVDDSIASAVAAAEKGDLQKAIKAAQKAGPAGAGFLKDIDAHLNLLLGQATDAVESRNMVPAVSIYNALMKEVKGTPQAERASEQLAAIKKDPELKRELEAAEAFEKTKRSVAGLSTAKQRNKFQSFSAKYRGTRAGDQARAMMKKK